MFKKISRWKKFEEAPKDKIILAGVDSYDCGWVYDSIYWSVEHNCWLIAGTDEICKPHMKYTHFMELHEPNVRSNVRWLKSARPPEKVYVVGGFDKNNRFKFSSVWYYEEQRKFMLTGTIPSTEAKLDFEPEFWCIPEDYKYKEAI